MLPLRQHALRRRVTPAPPRWEVAFGRRAPLEVDLGCGRGEYAWQRAVSFPTINVVALDNRKKWISRLRERCQARGISNLRAIRCDVTQDLPILFAESSVAAFTIHHPDPWWKKRHRKRRLVSTGFVELAARLLVPGGWVFLQTDVPDLADEMKAAFGAMPVFAPVDGEAWKRERMGDLRSHREKKCLQLGLPVRRLAYVLSRESGPAA